MARLPSCCSHLEAAASGDHDGKSSSAGCVTTAIDKADDGENAGGSGAVLEVSVVRLRRQPHPEDFWPDLPPSGAICRSDIAAESVEARSLKSNAVTLERLRGV